eukprot:3117860-Pleurochrysis_carterae.AAC.1
MYSQLPPCPQPPPRRAPPLSLARSLTHVRAPARRRRRRAWRHVTAAAATAPTQRRRRTAPRAHAAPSEPKRKRE